LDGKVRSTFGVSGDNKCARQDGQAGRRGLAGAVAVEADKARHISKPGFALRSKRKARDSEEKGLQSSITSHLFKPGGDTAKLS
jgi:hypothetical protein